MVAVIALTPILILVIAVGSVWDRISYERVFTVQDGDWDRDGVAGWARAKRWSWLSGPEHVDPVVVSMTVWEDGGEDYYIAELKHPREERFPLAFSVMNRGSGLDYHECRPLPVLDPDEVGREVARVVSTWARLKRDESLLCDECERTRHSNCGELWYTKEDRAMWRATGDVYLLHYCACQRCNPGSG